jgi:hypothetical protein
MENNGAVAIAVAVAGAPVYLEGRRDIHDIRRSFHTLFNGLIYPFYRATLYAEQLRGFHGLHGQHRIHHYSPLLLKQLLGSAEPGRHYQKQPNQRR